MPEPEQQSAGTWVKIALISGLLFGLLMGLFYSWQYGGVSRGLPAGMTAGLLFGPAFAFLMRRFAQRQISRFQNHRPDFADETVLIEGPANHFKGAEGVGGYLWVTKERVHFASHAFNVQKHVWTSSLSKIKHAQAVKTLGILNNGLLITTDTDEPHRFVVNNSHRWVEIILSGIKSA